MEFQTIACRDVKMMVLIGGWCGCVAVLVALRVICSGEFLHFKSNLPTIDKKTIWSNCGFLETRWTWW